MLESSRWPCASSCYRAGRVHYGWGYKKVEKEEEEEDKEDREVGSREKVSRCSGRWNEELTTDREAKENEKRRKGG